MAGERKQSDVSYKPYAGSEAVAQMSPKEITTPSGDTYAISNVSTMSHNSSGEQNVLSGFNFRYQQDGDRREFRVGVGYQGRVTILEKDKKTNEFKPAKVDKDLVGTILDVAEHPDLKAMARDRQTNKDPSTSALRRGLLKQFPGQFPRERLEDKRIMRGDAPRLKVDSARLG